MTGSAPLAFDQLERLARIDAHHARWLNTYTTALVVAAGLAGAAMVYEQTALAGVTAVLVCALIARIQAPSWYRLSLFSADLTLRELVTWWARLIAPYFAYLTALTAATVLLWQTGVPNLP